VVVLVGIGEDASFESIRAAAGNAVRAVKGEYAICLLTQIPIDEVGRAVVEGLVLGAYKYDTYKTPDEDSVELERIDLVGVSQAQIDRALVGAEATNLARDWSNTPAMDQSPEDIATAIVTAGDGVGIGIEVWDVDRIREVGLGALLGVAAGSSRPPVVVAMEYRPEGARGHLGLVGKGITFDSGGLSLKSASFMEEMKGDMAGGAAVAAAAIAIARLGIAVDVTAVIPFTDNAVGGNATRPGDVLRPVSGPTIEVLNTDAEGRLVLADGLGIVRRSNPDLIIDVATLTGASKVALGEKIGAVFGSDSDVALRVLTAAARAGETFWEMPLFKDYRKALDSNIADIKNVTGSRYGGAIAAALFLSEYAGEGDWAHLDIAGPTLWRETSGEFVKGATGFAVRTLIEVAAGMAEAD
jgi:leucyl aminopeptidase